jgi:hypothetical protein
VSAPRLSPGPGFLTPFPPASLLAANSASRLLTLCCTLPPASRCAAPPTSRCLLSTRHRAHPALRAHPTLHRLPHSTPLPLALAGSLASACDTGIASSRRDRTPGMPRCVLYTHTPHPCANPPCALARWLLTSAVVERARPVRCTIRALHL